MRCPQHLPLSEPWWGGMGWDGVGCVKRTKEDCHRQVILVSGGCESFVLLCIVPHEIPPIDQEIWQSVLGKFGS
jgi:hypothetical protein